MVKPVGKIISLNQEKSPDGRKNQTTHSRKFPTCDQDEEEQRVVEALYQRWGQVYKFVGWAVKRKINRDALLHALRACLAKRIPPGDCWAYCAGTLKITNGNHHEKDHVKNVKEDNIFNHIAEDLKKLYSKPQEVTGKEER
jgi:hypothetical protein